MINSISYVVFGFGTASFKPKPSNKNYGASSKRKREICVLDCAKPRQISREVSPTPVKNNLK